LADFAIFESAVLPPACRGLAAADMPAILVRFLATLWLVLASVSSPGTALAASDACTVPRTDLALAFDSSHSISADDFTLQKEGFARALTDPTKTPHDGSLCVTVVEFGDTAKMRVPYTCLDDAETAATVADRIRAVPLPGGDPRTGVELGMAAATAELAAHARLDARQVLVIATDGLPNVIDETCNVRPVPACAACTSLDQAIADARTAGIDELDFITVEDRENEVGPLVAADFTRFYGCRAFPQPGESAAPGFVVTVRDFTAFADAVVNRLPTIGCTTRIDVGDTSALPGGMARTVAAFTGAPNTAVGTAGTELVLDSAVGATCDRCGLAPGVTGATVHCASTTNGLHVWVVTDGGAALPDGALFACDLAVPEATPLGSRLAVHNRPYASAPDGAPLTTVGRDATVDVTSCPAPDTACSSATGTVLRLGRGRLVPGNTTSALRLRAALAGQGLASLDPRARFVFVQLVPEGDGVPFCAEVAGAALKRHGKALVFRDPQHRVGSARGLDELIVARGRGDRWKVRLRGRRVDLAKPAPGPVRVTVGFRAHDAAADVCSSATRELRSSNARVVVR
jgi:hypothetical protein